MTVRLRELVDSVADQGMTLVAGGGGLNRPVRWVHMVENEEIAGFLEGQEVAFVTGIGLETQEDLLGLVRSAYAGDASAVVVNIGPFIHQISPDTVRFCDAHDLPLFKVPWNVHMARIMHRFSLIITMDEKQSMELGAALENAIFHPDREEMYLEYLEQSGFGRDWNYCVAVISACVGEGASVQKGAARGAAFVGSAQAAAAGASASVTAVPAPGAGASGPAFALGAAADSGFAQDAAIQPQSQPQPPSRSRGAHDDARVAAFARRIESLATVNQWRVAVTVIEGRLTLVFARYDAEEVDAMLRRMSDAVKAAGLSLARTYIGVGKVTRSARCIAKSYNQALRLERLQHRRGREGEIALYDRSGIDKLLLAVPDRDILVDFYDDSIGPLVEYDRVNGTDLTETLRVYLRYSGSVKETAARMFVHRNTVGYKLNRIADILGVDLSDFAVREFLSIGLQVREVLEC